MQVKTLSYMLQLLRGCLIRGNVLVGIGMWQYSLVWYKFWLFWTLVKWCLWVTDTFILGRSEIHSNKWISNYPPIYPQRDIHPFTRVFGIVQVLSLARATSFVSCSLPKTLTLASFFFSRSFSTSSSDAIWRAPPRRCGCV